MNLRKAIATLLVLAIGLPIVQALLAWVAVLLEAMGDDQAAGIVRGVNMALGVAWLASLVALTVTLGLKAINDERPHDE
jgi:heme A synthase